ncbi:phosphonate degradation HD-domain oxygenase [Burkholderia glumae]|uniref:HD domain-containing protein n=1 Tax=Burkholderia glumae TaxID=337 RepID=A0AAQ0BT37_BURGL|nr:phosphonate degradation HD-domain oxygenase [Burkholderia glumae]ACR30853.1 HD phosphohydrolase-like protein [Burkholderia glumae BGR1]AJY62898.1 HD domain protein [Burkholderia glumae LMG 2196 = ATCC 33617]KHJ62221.1 phosphohydrolase [Burkholderia glumae]MCM2483836.1 HD domain-containing protein [Burkholderia glumae]MCM2509530.1 HD domain-containing protein [Burkholderia glumae]
MALTLADIRALFEQRGATAYSGEPVTQLEHALQSAQLAEEDEAGDALVTAALLHDLGHLLNEQGETPSARGIDDLHQYYALPFLRGLFPDAVLEPIRLHVDAKRCLCAIEPGYARMLSEDSVRSLTLQGGAYHEDEARAFLLRPYAADAVRLRRWDDGAKLAGGVTQSLDHFLRIASCVVRA